MRLSEEKLRAAIRKSPYTIEDFCEKIDIPRSTFYRLLPKNDFTDGMIVQMAEVLGVSKQDIIETNVQPTTHDKMGGNIIYIPLVAYGGFLHGYANKIYVDSLERFSLPGITGEHYAFEVDGMSMWDYAAPGDKAIARLEEKLEWMVKGKPYVLQTIDGLLIKLFDKIIGEKAYFHSYNKEYDGLELPLKSLKRVYFVNHILKKT